VADTARAAAVCGLVGAAGGAAGGAFWAWLTAPATYQVTAQSAYLDEQGLSAAFNADGWFLVVGLLCGLLLGAVLGLSCRRHGWPLVLALVVAASLASFVAYRVGQALGPGPLEPRLRAAAPGDRVAAPLSVRATGVYLGWPVGTMLGVLMVTLRWRGRERS
jgi:hypothetical protein